MTDSHNGSGMGDTQEINLLELAQVVVKRKKLILKICSLAVAASLGYSLTLPNIYSATAKVLPPQKDSGGGLASMLGQMGGIAGLAASGLGGGGSDLYLGLLKSRSLGDAVIKRLDLVKVYQAENLEAARKKLDAKVKVQAGKEGIISITAEDKDPRRAAVMANTIVDELEKLTLRLNLSKAGTERLFLEKRLELVNRDLKKAEDEMKAFGQSSKIIQPDTQAKASIEGIARLKAELANHEVQLAVLRSNRTDQSPDVIAVLTGIKRIKGELAALSGNGNGGESIPSVGTVPALGLEYVRKLRELKTQEAILEQLTKQYEVAKLNEAKDSSSLQVLDEAVVPFKKSKPSRTLIVTLAAVASFFVSIFYVVAQEYLAKMSSEDREVLGTLKNDLFTKPKR